MKQRLLEFINFGSLCSAFNMSYDIRYLTMKPIDYINRFGEYRDLSALREKLYDYDRSSGTPVFHASGFDHFDAPVITNKDPGIVQFFSWGLIPYWVKNVNQAIQLSNRTLNAHCEHIFEKPSFKEAAKKRRCLVIVDGFYQHHHRNGKTFPYHFTHRNLEPLALGGLWEQWKDGEDDFVRNTFTIVTTEGNELLSGIHNNPKLNGPRMPLIIPWEYEDTWLNPETVSSKDLEDVIRPYESELLRAYPVRKLRGKGCIGNRPEIIEPFEYPELNTLFD